MPLLPGLAHGALGFRPPAVLSGSGIPAAILGGWLTPSLQWLGPRQGMMCGNFLLLPVPLGILLFSPSALVVLFYPSEKGPSIFCRLFLSCPSSPAPPEEKEVPLAVVWEGWSPS